MSKQKRSAPITAWLKKENQREEKGNESDAKVFKKSLRVCLEPLNKNILYQAEEGDVLVKNFQVQQKNQQEVISCAQNQQTRKGKNGSAENQNLNSNQGYRRSARNLPPDQKPIEQPIVKQPKIEDLPPILFKGRINYIHDFYDCANVCDKLLNEVENTQDKVVPVGFDLEWPFSFQTGSGKTALAQICLSEKECHLLHIYNIKKLPASFIAFLSHPKVKLVGVNIKNDVWKLTRDFNEFPGQKVVDNNCLDCGPYANIVFHRSGRWSLERLTAYLLKKRINKDKAVRNSKWHLHPLSDAQKLYAATDAYVSLLLHLTIERQEAIAEAEGTFAAAELTQDLF